MNYGYLFSMELQKMARTINFDPSRAGDAGDAMDDLAKRNYQARALHATQAGSGNGWQASRSPGVNKPWVVGGAGQTVAQSAEQAKKGVAAVKRKAPNAFTPKVAQR